MWQLFELRELNWLRADVAVAHLLTSQCQKENIYTHLSASKKLLSYVNLFSYGPGLLCWACVDVPMPTKHSSLSKEPYIYSAYIRKTALYMRKRALHIRQKSPIYSQTKPIDPLGSSIYHSKSTQRCQKCTQACQKSAISTAHISTKQPTHAQKSHVYIRKQNPVYPRKEPYVNIHKRGLWIRKTARYILKRALWAVTRAAVPVCCRYRAFLTG